MRQLDRERLNWLDREMALEQVRLGGARMAVLEDLAGRRESAPDHEGDLAATVPVYRGNGESEDHAVRAGVELWVHAV